MANFVTPERLNGAELIEELADAGLIVERIVDNSDGTISFNTDYESLAASVVAQHDGTVIPPEPTIEDKLQSVGLTVADLQTALGL